MRKDLRDLHEAARLALHKIRQTGASWREEYTTLEKVLDRLAAEPEEPMETLLRFVLKSAIPHPEHHPTMWGAWRLVEETLGIPEGRSNTIGTSNRKLAEELLSMARERFLEHKTLAHNELTALRKVAEAANRIELAHQGNLPYVKGFAELSEALGQWEKSKS